MYEELPEGVSFPKSAADIQQLVEQAHKEGFSITPRSAGTSLAGQATGGGVIMDVSRFMTDIREINVDERYAVVHPGVIRDTLNRELEEQELLFGPDTSTTNRCMIGGMIGNNSSGSFSIKHKTTREHVLEMKVVLSDGSLATFKPLSEEELEEKKQLDNLEGYIYRSMLRLIEEHKELIYRNYPHPEIIRRNTGYALDKLAEMQPFDPDGRPFNMCELLCGSEGTLAMTTSAKLNLVTKDKTSILAVPQFTNLQEALVATREAVKVRPAAIELVDHIILEATKGNIEQRKNRFFLKGEPKYILIIQFDGSDNGILRLKTEQLKEKLNKLNLGYTCPVIEDPEKVDQVWELRKAGLGLLMGLGEESRSPTFCEDTAVRVSDLPEYVSDFQEILDKYNTECVFYAHASVGELHLRPVVDITTERGLQIMKNMADEIAELVRRYRGSLSGEHGDGRARSPYIEKVLGKELMSVLKEVKEIWDPDNIFNPGKIVSSEALDSDLRFSPDYKRPDIDTVFAWRDEGNMGVALELCNGAGVCRKLAESGGTMCPSYMATRDEKDSTRGRANVFRQVFEGDDPEGFASEELKEALDLCLSCKACKSECPANVDMAKMKAEFMNGWHEIYDVTKGERFFAESGKLFPLASMMPRMVNTLVNSGFGKRMMELILKIDSRRELPDFASQTFKQWFKEHTASRRQAGKWKVLLFVDLFTNYNEPEVGIAAVRVLESMGFEVLVADTMQTGRAQISKGMLEDAKQICKKTIKELKKYAQARIPIIGLEPSEVLTLRDEFLELCEPYELLEARRIAKRSYTFEEFLALHSQKFPGKAGGEHVMLHGHCHMKALVGNKPSVMALEAVGYTVEEIPSGCCGMAGSFGYEKEHYDLSMDIGELVLFPHIREHEAKICASGFSCRHQIKDGTGEQAYHLAQLLADTIRDKVEMEM
ncbi:MAG: FAD-binding protein [Balneolaceae bacterium]|nr:FAD-binding protein [Balneolaceae bacterium]